MSDWLSKTGGHVGRQRWWACYPKRTLLYTVIAKQLMSIRTEGSISVERVAKPLKNKVWTDERNASDRKTPPCCSA